MRELVTKLRELGEEPAPRTLRPAVLVAVGRGDAYAWFETPIGRCYVAFNDLGISAVHRAESDEAFAAAFRRRFGRPIFPSAEPPATLRRAMGQWERGERAEAMERLRFDLRGVSEFGRAVLLKALDIPWGEVRPYYWLAREIGNPRAVRAVGTALGDNPIPLLIPCHRVVRSDGRIGSYGFGSEAKRALLAVEGLDPDGFEALARARVRYHGSATTRIYCFPTCRHARQIDERHRVAFHSAVEATAAGYRPCRICRPA